MNPGDLYVSLDAAFASREGVGPLMARELRRRDLQVPPSLTVESRQLAAAEVVRGVELRDLCDELEAARIPLLIAKGTALAYTLYETPSLRPRCDTDIIVARVDAPRVAELLTRRGYHAEEGASGEVVNAQRTFSRVDPLGIRHAVDVHWATSNRPRLARALPFAELWARGVAFGAHELVRIPDAEDAMLLAATHLAGHHRGEERLIWLHDIHMLAAIVNRRRLLERARALRVTRELAAALAAAACVCDGGSARSHRPSALAQMAADLHDTAGVRGKLQILREHLFPPTDYILWKYRTRRRALLPILYLWRAAGLVVRPQTLFATIPLTTPIGAVRSGEKSKPVVRQGRKA